MQGQKTGGRQKGTPNKATKELKQFLQGVFAQAFENGAFRDLLLTKILLLELDAKILITLLAYAYGKPAQAVDHKHTGKFTLAQLIAGTAVEADDDDQVDQVAEAA